MVAPRPQVAPQLPAAPAPVEHVTPPGSAQAGAGSPFSGMYDEGQVTPRPAGPYRTPWANVFLSGITEEKDRADYASNYISGHRNGVALYEGTNPNFDPNARNRDMWSDDPAVAAAANERNNTDLMQDMIGVTQFARLGDNVQIDRNGQLVVNHEALNDPVQTGGENGQQYLSPEAIGNQGADTALRSNPQLARMMAAGGDPMSNPELAQQFISLTGHSGGGQSSFYTALELYERGFRNVSLVGYEMAMSPHQREVLEQLNIPVTNLTGHTGGPDNYLNSTVGEGIRLGMGGDLDYYDASIDRGGDGMDVAAQHDITNNDQVTTMLRYSTWLDSVGMHQQWSDENYQAFLAATGGQGNVITNGDGQHAAQSPLGGSFVDNHQQQDSIYLRTPEWTGQDVLNGLNSVPFVGSWLGQQAENLGNSLTPNFADTRLPHLDVGINPNLSTQGSIDLSHGAAQGSVGLGGSTVDVAGAHLTVPDWVQASGGVNLSQGAANVNLGGQNGVGADMNLSQGNLDLNVFGNKIDVDQGIRDVGQSISTGVSNLGRGISNFFGFGR